jgi:hypothetical protein
VHHLAEAADQLADVVELDVGVDAEHHVAAVQEIGAVAALDQEPLELLRDRRLAGARLAGEHDDARRVAGQLGAADRRDEAARPVARPELALEPPLAEVVGHHLAHDAAACDVVAVDDDEPAGGLEIGGGVERDRLAGAQHQIGDVVPVDLLLRGAVEVGGVEHPVDLVDGHLGGGGSQLELVAAARRHRRASQPEQVDPQLGRYRRRRPRVAHDLAARDVQLLVEGDAGRLAGERLLPGRRAEHLDALDHRGLAGR